LWVCVCVRACVRANVRACVRECACVRYQEAKYNIPGWSTAIPRIWFFKNKYKHLTVQGGQFVLVRESSQPCLTYWREMIDSNVSESKDQPALQRMRSARRNGRCQVVTMDLGPHLFFPTNTTMDRDVNAWYGWGMKFQSQPTLLHLKNSCNVTANFDTDIEERYILNVIQNPELSKKIHIAPDHS
jgi:hypothetical protein